MVQGAGTSVGADDATSKIIQRNTDMGSCVWIIKWPNKNGVFQDFGVNLNSTTVTGANIKTLNMLADPSAIKVPVGEKLVLFWKPKIMGTKFMQFMPTQTTTTGNYSVPSFNSVSKAVKFPWSNIVDNFEAGHAVPNAAYLVGQQPNSLPSGPNSMHALYYAMTQPLIALYNTNTDQFLGTEAAQEVTMGRWRIHTVFEFRNKVGYTMESTANPPDVTTQNWVDQMIDGKQNV